MCGENSVFGFRVFNRVMWHCLSLAAVFLSAWPGTAQSSQTVQLSSFSAVADGQYVTTYLPLYRLGVENGVLVTEATYQNGRWVTPTNIVAFNSTEPQSVEPSADVQCTIYGPNWLAYLTTYYVILEQNGVNEMYVLRGCGKAAINFDGTQFPGQTSDNFVNHAQMAANAQGLPIGSTVSVVAAGEIDIIEGKVVYIDNCSGHFKPTVGATLAYMNLLTGPVANPGPVTLTDPLQSAVAAQSISDGTIAYAFIANQSGGAAGNTPQRWIDAATGNQQGVRSGTGDCNGYTTVFLATKTPTGSQYDLTGGLMIYRGGNINVFQSTVNAVSWQNLKQLYLDWNLGVYSYQANAITDWHLWNNTLELSFTDETNDTYWLSISNFSYNHEVDYNSSKPNIKKITIAQYWGKRQD